ncbi:MAG TPA: c-type cytochrome [Membranihabitans sp.]|nr:c-type cytochrome [Membranihabitans sp.]
MTFHSKILPTILFLLVVACQSPEHSSTSLADRAANEEIARLLEAFPGRGALTDESQPVPADKALMAFDVSEDLEMDLVLSEPQVNQPLEISFDAQGRLWVIHYNQYPYPEGVKITGLDNHLRVEFDKVPDAPPEGVKGADKITIFEDTDGDGTYDRAIESISGLNIATSASQGYGKIWVLNPPYLISFPDADGDGIPNGEPTVHLRGFGLQDTHAVANSLRWGPDGWLYGAQGSTTISSVSSKASPDTYFEGQAIWRYHPISGIFEIFAEGGGNTFNVEFDAQGRIFSGHNGYGRGPYYKQGAYYEKSWGKHGPLTNPYAFGFLSDMTFEGERSRFTHAIHRYEGGQLPDRYAGNFIALNPLQGKIQLTAVSANGSSLRTVDQDILVTTEDRWFRPLDIQTGPDGMVYFSDWYDSRLSHVDPRDTWNKTSGRIYRLRHPDSQPGYAPFDLTQMSSEELVRLLDHENRWYRQKSREVLRDRGDQSILPTLMEMLAKETDQPALEALWAIHAIGAWDDNIVHQGLDHSYPYVRMWSIRLAGDQDSVSMEVAQALVRSVIGENHPEVRSQLAATASRLPYSIALPIIQNLLLHHDDSEDPDIPLQIWWALESKVEAAPEAVADLFHNPQIWYRPIVRDFILHRLMQRYIMAGGQKNLAMAQRLFESVPGKMFGEKLMNGLQEGLRGKSVSTLPEELLVAMEPYRATGEGEYAMTLRQNPEEILPQVLEIVADPEAELSERLSYIRIMGENDFPNAVPVLLDILKRRPIMESKAVKITALNALQRYDQNTIATDILAAYPNILREDPEVRLAALNLLVSRQDWAIALIDEITGTSVIHSDDVPIELANRMILLDDEALTEQIHKIWPATEASSTDQKFQSIKRLASIIKSGTGEVASGKIIYSTACGICHRLNDEGGNIGPDLTGYDRQDLSTLLIQIVDPSNDIREGYVNYLIRTHDGRTITGFLSDRSEHTITVQPYGSKPIHLSMAEIEKLEPQSTSLMPEGILERLSDQEVQDLFAYLMD